MTTIHASAAGDSARYYTRYLTGDGVEGEGRWAGRQAEALGLSGAVSTETLEALLSGHDPVTGTRLGSALRDRVDARGRLIRAVGGFDGTFSAPKSVSVLWALTGDDGWSDAHDVAVRAVLDHVERYGATTRVRTNGARRFPDALGLIMAVFGQATSRADDPQLHTHVVFSAKVQTGSGWYALDARYLKRKQRALGGLYQSVLRAELSHRYRVRWGSIVNGQAEIAGVPDELLAAFSKRTAEVDAALAAKVAAFRAREGRDPTRWERAALTREAAGDTRAAKTGADPDGLAGRWRDEAAAAGWSAEGVLAGVRAAARDAGPAGMPTVGEVLDAVSATSSSWGRIDVLQAICDLTPPPARPVSGRDWARTLERAADEVLAACTSLDPEPAPAEVRASDGRSLWIPPIEPGHSSEAVLAQEERIVAFALDAHRHDPSPSSTVEVAGLDVLQAGAARAVAGGDRLVIVVGPAGAGKTTMLRAAVTDLGHHDRAVFAVAPTAKAASLLRRDTGAGADTIAKLLYESDRPGGPNPAYQLPAGATLIVDEAGMVGTGTLDRLVSLAQAQRWRVVLVGDPRQLHAVGRGGMFDELCRTSPIHELATIHRFHQRWERAASLALRAGRPTAIDAYLDHHRVTPGRFDDHAAAAACRWIELTATGKHVAVIAETNEHVDALNTAIQHERRRAGQLDARTAPVAAGETVAVGDVVVTRRNDRTLRTSRGEPVRNRDRWTVTGLGADGTATVAHHGGAGSVVLPADYARGHVRLGYAGTAHSYQGDTVDVGIAVITPATTHRSLYVAATRGREHNQLLVVTDTTDPDDARDVLHQALGNDRADTPAVVQRRELALQAPKAPTDTAEQKIARARAAYQTARQRAQPHLDAIERAGQQLEAARDDLRRANTEAAQAPLWRRRAAHRQVLAATEDTKHALDRHATARDAAEPYTTALRIAAHQLRETEHYSAVDITRQRLERLAWDRSRDTPERSRDHGIEL